MLYHQLTQEERYMISSGSALRLGVREIARQMEEARLEVKKSYAASQ